MEGFYAVYYTGVAGFGHAVIVMQDGVVSGADATGGTYDGTYRKGKDAQVSVEVTLTAPAGTTLVTGQTLPVAYSQTIVASLPENFSGGHTVPIQTPLGPVNAVFKKLRGLK